MSGGATAPREWDAATYDRVSGPQLALGREVLARLPLRGDETVLDAGCGSGRVTRELLERLPHGRVVAVDASARMVELARRALDHRAEVRRADLAEVVLDKPVDAVFSNAVFHWVGDHERLFARLFAALRPGGRLVAQCGGAGNLDALHERVRALADREPFARHLTGWGGPWRFASAAETAAVLRAAGFETIDTWLERREVEPEEPHAYLATVCLGHHLERMPEELRDRFVTAVAEASPTPLRLPYVRLNIDAHRPR